MGHLYVVCGPPGAGKTTLLKWLSKERPALRQVQRMTTREPRLEEGDSSHASSEYLFHPHADFPNMVAHEEVMNLIEWNGNYYATPKRKIEEVLRSRAAKVLLEDIPSAIHLKNTYGSRVTIIFLFVTDVEGLTDLAFTSNWCDGHPVFDDWVRRLRQKYLSSQRVTAIPPKDSGWKSYLCKKVRRANIDIAFIAGQLRSRDDIRVLANLEGQQKSTFAQFTDILDAPLFRVFISHSQNDKCAAELKKALATIRIDSFFDKENLPWGARIGDNIAGELRRCSHIIVVLSPTAMDSNWVPFEIGQAVALGKGILPYSMVPVENLPEYLKQYAPVDNVDSVLHFFEEESKLVGRQ